MSEAEELLTKDNVKIKWKKEKKRASQINAEHLVYSYKLDYIRFKCDEDVQDFGLRLAGKPLFLKPNLYAKCLPSKRVTYPKNTESCYLGMLDTLDIFLMVKRDLTVVDDVDESDESEDDDSLFDVKLERVIPRNSCFVHPSTKRKRGSGRNGPKKRQRKCEAVSEETAKAIRKGIIEAFKHHPVVDEGFTVVVDDNDLDGRKITSQVVIDKLKKEISKATAVPMKCLFIVAVKYGQNIPINDWRHDLEKANKFFKLRSCGNIQFAIAKDLHYENGQEAVVIMATREMMEAATAAGDKSYMYPKALSEVYGSIAITGM
jgi:hypothetical protein